LTLRNNTGNAIIDGGNPNPPIFNFVNAVSNRPNDGYGVFYATRFGFILSDCVFVDNLGRELFRSSETETYVLGAPFRLTNCFLDGRPSMAYYTVVADVITRTKAKTHTMVAFETEVCDVEMEHASPEFAPTAVFSASQANTPRQQPVVRRRVRPN
jgi:hypothetical protein